MAAFTAVESAPAVDDTSEAPAVEDFHPQPGKQEPAPQPAKHDPSPAELFQQKLFNVLGGAMTSSLIALGDTLNIYKTMKELGKLSCAELADACKLSERFLREWLHQQVSGKNSKICNACWT